MKFIIILSLTIIALNLIASARISKNNNKVKDCECETSENLIKSLQNEKLTFKADTTIRKKITELSNETQEAFKNLDTCKKIRRVKALLQKSKRINDNDNHYAPNFYVNDNVIGYT